MREAFRAVAGINTFGDEQEAIQIANDTPYGLAAYFSRADAVLDLCAAAVAQLQRGDVAAVFVGEEAGVP